MHLGGKKPRKISDLLAMIMFAFKPKEFNRRLRSVLIIIIRRNDCCLSLSKTYNNKIVDMKVDSRVSELE